MQKPIVFFCRCKPDGYDIIDIVRKQRRAFIGYPAWREGKFGHERDFRSALYNIRSENPDNYAVDKNIRTKAYKSQIRANYNLVGDVVNGSIVLIPRPALGIR